jgi:hypothetical protein
MIPIRRPDDLARLEEGLRLARVTGVSVSFGLILLTRVMSACPAPPPANPANCQPKTGKLRNLSPCAQLFSELANGKIRMRLPVALNRVGHRRSDRRNARLANPSWRRLTICTSTDGISSITNAS